MKNITLTIIALFALATPSASFAADQSSPGKAGKSVASQNSGVKTFTVLYSNAKNMAPNNFTLKAGERVRIEVNPLDTATGCMNTIMVPGLWDKPEPIIKGKKIVMEFTPQRPGSYKITCAMGVNRGVIVVK
jgi:heme/copper-type cytochrome/quinol oxidase subunit 2